MKGWRKKTPFEWSESVFFMELSMAMPLKALLHLAHLSNTLPGQITTPVTLGIKGQNSYNFVFKFLI